MFLVARLPQDHNTTEGPGDEYLCREGIDIFAFSKEDYLYLSGQAAKPRAIRGYQDMPFLWFEAECGSFLTESQKGGGYAGNESTGPDINKIYLHSALIIELCHPLE